MRIIALDVGKKRIGVAIANSDIKIARPYDIVLVEGKEFAQICEIILEEKISRIVVGKPRSNEGNETEQTKYVYRFMRRLQRFCIQQGYNFPEVEKFHILNAPAKSTWKPLQSYYKSI